MYQSTTWHERYKDLRLLVYAPQISLFFIAYCLEYIFNNVKNIYNNLVRCYTSNCGLSISEYIYPSKKTS
jgi:hypothetical protein